MVFELSIIKSGISVAFYTLISRIFGLIRELVIANFFGTNLYADAVNTAFKFPNLFRRIFGEGALASVFVPIYSGKIIEDKEKAKNFASQIFTLLAIFLILLTVFFEIFMPQILIFIAPGFMSDTTKFELSTLLCRITTPYLTFISLSALLGGIQNSHNKFAPFAFVPILLNIAVIIACLFGDSEYSKSINVSLGILAGGALQFGFMQFICIRGKINPTFLLRKNLSRESVLFLKNMIPATLASSVTQINLFISQAIASFAPGAISILSYADRIYQFPLSIIGICFGTVLLPSLSLLHKKGDSVEALKLQTQAIKLSLFLSLACMFGIISLAHPIMHVIYERGAFTSVDTLKTAETIAMFALGLPAFILNKVLNPILFAKLDTKTPLKITTITILTNIVLNLLLIRDFQHLGIALGTSISSWINVALLFAHFKKNKLEVLAEKISFYLFKLIIIGTCMSGLLYFASSNLHSILYVNNALTKFIALLLIIFLGGGFYFGMAIAFKIITKQDIKKLFNKKHVSTIS